MITYAEGIGQGFHAVRMGPSTTDMPCNYGAGYIIKRTDDIAILIYDTANDIMYKRQKTSGTWRDWKTLITDSDLGIVIKNSGNVAAIFDDEVQIATITLPANHKYLVLAHTRSTQSFKVAEAIMNCNIKKISGTTNSVVGMGTTRTPMDYGGSCTAWGIVDTATSCVYGLFGYGYYSAQYDYAGEICAIQLA